MDGLTKLKNERINLWNLLVITKIRCEHEEDHEKNQDIKLSDVVFTLTFEEMILLGDFISYCSEEAKISPEGIPPKNI